MSTQSTFYQARAAEERDKASGSTLDNVRDGHLRAAAAWDALAARSLKADRMRAEEELRKSEVRSADMAMPMMAQQELQGRDLPDVGRDFGLSFQTIRIRPLILSRD
ncbi:MAG: hypothetical protein LH466_00110 [Sphingomonas bacterium]|nr:hypothetical protein [Sphingomonas bacterium]